jgi:NADH:ubiquinone oxidoreductase subunit 6 (subunit J)
VPIVVFFVASVAAIASAGAVVVQRNPFISAIALIGHLAALATLYLTLRADFVAAAQIIVYAGAVMVMFLFVIAYIGPRAELVGERYRSWQLWLTVVAGGAILVEIALAVGRAGLDAPAAASDGFGSPQAIGRLFLTRYVGTFEIVSLLLLVAAIAAVVLGAGPRPSRVTHALGDEDPAAAASARHAASQALIASVRGDAAE